MKIGLNNLSMRIDEIVEGALMAEELGYDSIWYGEHILLAHELKIPYPEYPPPYGAQEFVDVFTLLGFLAAKTKRLRFASGVLLLPLRAPIMAARAIVGLDILSGGRFDLGVGVGWNQEEFDAAGSDISTRGERLDEMLDLLQILWTKENVEYHGKHYHVPSAPFVPKPLTKSGPPVLVGGHSDAALRRAARWDGWYIFPPSIEFLKQHLERIERLRGELGRQHKRFEVIVGLRGAPSRKELDGYFTAGADRIVLSPWGRDYSNALKRIETYAKEIGLET